ncbi:poly [ADP-ribose] polymerase 14-like isoform X2 [Mizuhopecten yessoensis]|uniref:poly [ADP-ribose] polymerase 14-like isoform X2 n=1 Tax=Mizuhopecten yessoensis TaxID=6573 RepID=UPI000B458DEB|nr:poly [ADP-ribose] polymerase 14-like isoform X2 [Mizuhopecten yessoensis]
MDIRDEVAKTCILIKSIPFDTDDKSISSAVSDEATVCRVFRYTEQADNSTRFIAQLSNRQDADRLIRSNGLYLRNPDHEKVKVEVGFCPECIVPTEWVECSPSDLMENNDPDTEHSDRHGDYSNRFLQETNDNGAVRSAAIEEPNTKDDLVTKFSALTVFSDEEEKNEDTKNGKDKDADDLLIPSTDTEREDEPSEKAADDTEVYRRPSQKATEVQSTSDPDVAKYSPPQHDTPQADTYEPMGDIYIPMWKMTPKHRPVPLMEPSVTKTSIEKGQRSLSVCVDHHKSLTETDVLVFPDNKENQRVMDSRCDSSRDSVLGGHDSVVTGAADKGENSPEISKGVEGQEFVKDTFPSEIEHEECVQSINTSLKFQANELESAKLTEIAGKEMEKFKQTITGDSDSYKQIGDFKTKHKSSQEILKNEAANLHVTTGDQNVGEVATRAPPVAVTSQPVCTGDQQSPPSHSHTPSPVLLHPIQPHTGQSGQGQPLQPSQCLAGQFGQEQPLQSFQPPSGQFGQGQQPAGQFGQVQQLTGQLGQDQQSSGQFGQVQQLAGQLGQGQHLTGKFDQGQQLAGQLDPQQPQTSQFNQGLQFPGQLGPSQPLTGRLSLAPENVGQRFSNANSQQMTQQGQGPTQPITDRLSLAPENIGQRFSNANSQQMTQQGQGPTQPLIDRLSAASEIVGQQFSNVYCQQGQQILPALNYPQQGQSGHPHWAEYYPYQGSPSAAVFYQQHWGPGYPGMPQFSNPGMTPHQTPHMAPPGPQHHIIPPQNIVPHQVAPPSGTYGVITHPSFPALYPSASSPEAPPLTAESNITRPMAEQSEDLVTENKYLATHNDEHRQEIRTNNHATTSETGKGDTANSIISETKGAGSRKKIENLSAKMEEDSLRELEQWAQSSSPRQRDATSGEAADSREENLYDSILSIEGAKPNQISVQKDFGHIKLLNGELSHAKVDVIVNLTNKDLKLNLGNVSKSILEAAGQEIQEECRKTYPRGIRQDLIAVTSGGRLSCRKIFHIIVPRWDGVAESLNKILGKLVTTCISMAIRQEMTSIAFPAIGTGKMGYPADLVAKAMLQSTKMFLTNEQLSNFLVCFVIYHGDTAIKKAFEDTAMLVLKSNDEVEPMEVDEQDYDGGHTYTQISYPHDNQTYVNVGDNNKDEHLYLPLKFSQSGAQQNSSLESDDSDLYMCMNQNKKDGTYVNMQEVKKQRQEDDAYAFVQGHKKQVEYLKDKPMRNTETPKIRQRTSEMETAERSPKGSKFSEDLPSIPDQQPQFLRVTYPRPFPEDTVRFYFENKKRSGGGEIVKFNHYLQKKVTLIQFKDSEAVSRVIAKTHKLESLEIQVSMVTGEMPSNIEEKKLLISGINPKTTYDTLVNFLEVRAKAVPTEVIYGNRKDRAVVSFESKPDFDYLREVCQAKSLEGNLLKVSLVPVPSVVLVKNCPDVSEDTILLFFENEKRSGGGDVEKVELILDHQECLVHFVDPAVAKRVCDPEQKLQIEKKTVTASLYYPFLRSAESKSLVKEASGEKQTGQLRVENKPVRQHSDKKSPEQRLTRELPNPPLAITMKFPSPVTLTDIEPRLTEFIMTSDPNKSAFENMMSKVEGKVSWPKNLETDFIRITCVIDVTSERAALEVKQWSAKIYRNVKKFFGAMTTEEVPVVKQVWESVISELKNMNIPYPDGVAVRLNQQHYTIVISGHAKYVKDLKKNVEEITTRNEKSLRKEAEQVSKSEFLKMFQIQILWKFKFKNKIKKLYPKLEIEIDVDNRKISFSGVLEEVDQARIDMRLQLETSACETLAISRGMRDLFFRVPAKNEFVQLLKQRHLVAVWDLPPHQDICRMYAETSPKAKEAVTLFTQVLKEKKIPMEDDLAKVVESTKWQSTLKDLFSKYPEEIQINVEENSIFVTAVCKVFDKICDCIDTEIRDYKDIHDVHKEFLPVEEGVFRFLEKYKRYDIETCTLAIQKTLKLQLKTRNSKVKPGYDLEGTRDALRLARNKIKAVIDQVSMDTHMVKAVGAADYFNSTDGRDKIGMIESAVSAIIRKSAEYRGVQEVSGQSSQPVMKAKCQVGQSKQCIVVEGDMTLLKVDVMVNAANTDMMHGGGIAGAISAAGGSVIQKECDDYVTKHGPVPEGKAICSSSGRLPCKMVVHTVGPIWQDGSHGEEKKLQEAVYRSLEIVHEQGYSSVALPAISAGIFGYPLPKSVETIVSMVQHFVFKRPTTRIKHVYLCDTDHQTVKLFVKELVSTYGPQKVKTYDGTGSSSSDEDASDEEISEEDDEEEEDTDDEAKDVRRTSSHRKITVEVLRGELAKTKADVLVNSTGKDLMLNVGMLSKTLLQYGGQSLQTECTSSYPRGIQPGDVAITKGGNLQCQQVYHGTFDSWGNEQRGCVKTLEKFVSTCLHTANKCRMASIAFPALGTGRLSYPPATVANVMLSCVRGFERDMPNSCLRTVMFVIYPQDRQSVQDFETAVDKDSLRPGGATGSRGDRAVSRNYGASVSLGQVDIEIKQGDITKATTPAIVNSTGDHLDLTRGAVSKAILKAGGQNIQVECNARRMDMQSRGLVVTSGGSLMCRFILHVRSCTRESDWAQAVSTCLREADRLKCDSLTFPALGTGQIGCAPKDVADTMFTAIRQLTDQLRHLRKVSIVIYQADMVDTFKAQLKRHLRGADTPRRTNTTKEAYKSTSKTRKSKGHRSQTSSYVRPDNVQFLMWSDSPSKFRNAKSRIDQACDSELRKLTVPLSYKEIIKGLNTYQIDELNGLGSKRNVHIIINQSRGEITLEGRRLPTSDLLPEIQNLLHKFEKHKDEVEKAKTVADYVQWLYDDSGKWRRFNAEVNLMIEKAYKAKEVKTKVMDSNGIIYIIDFQKMVEYETSLPHKKYKIERRDRGARSPGGIGLPKSWTPMGKVTYQLVKLSTSDEEYKKTEQAFRASVGKASTQPLQAGHLHRFMMQGFMAPNYGHQQIVQIQRVQNKSLYQQYTAKKQELWTRNNKDPEKWLWHGTSSDTVEKVAMKGFDRSYCGKNATAYGNGVYFAVDASYSMGYCQHDNSGLKHMFYTQVLTGESCPGHSGMKYLPDRKGAGSTALPYDSATNNVSAPSMYIIFHDSQAYPSYLISFR